MPRNSKADTIRDIDSAREDFEFRVDAYLKSRGWKSTCSNSASLWLWERTLADGRVMLTNKSTALAFERHTFDGSEDEQGEC